MWIIVCAVYICYVKRVCQVPHLICRLWCVTALRGLRSEAEWDEVRQRISTQPQDSAITEDLFKVNITQAETSIHSPAEHSATWLLNWIIILHPFLHPGYDFVPLCPLFDPLIHWSRGWRFVPATSEFPVRSFLFPHLTPAICKCFSLFGPVPSSGPCIFSPLQNALWPTAPQLQGCQVYSRVTRTGWLSSRIGL